MQLQGVELDEEERITDPELLAEVISNTWPKVRSLFVDFFFCPGARYLSS